MMSFETRAFDRTQLAFDAEVNSDSHDSDFDFESWEVHSCWKQQQANRFGGGTAAPSIPRSQRQYDGDNWFDYCEVCVN